MNTFGDSPCNQQVVTKQSDGEMTSFDKQKELFAMKGKKWKNHNLSKWLEKKLKISAQSKEWSITAFEYHDSICRRVLFSKKEYKDYIWNHKSLWNREDIWLWDEQLTSKEEEIKHLLHEYGLEQQRSGKHVVFYDNYLEVNGEKWTYVEKTKRIMRLQYAAFFQWCENRSIKKELE